MMKQILIAVAATALLASAACAQATPTIDPNQIQASAVAAAGTMVAMTQAAIPTATELPPSPNPSPTELPSSPTPFALPTLDNSFPTASAPTASTGGDPCNQPLSLNPAGKKTPIHIINNTKGTVNLSLYLNKTPFGECGFARIAPIPKGGSADYLLPSGTYYACGYANDPKHASTPCGFTFTTKGPLKITLFIKTDTFAISQ